MRTFARMAFFILLVFVMACERPIRGDLSTISYWPAISERDTNPRLVIDTSQPFHLVFARGPVLFGMDTVSINENGNVKLQRLNRSSDGWKWESTTLTLSSDALSDIANYINKHRITKLKKAYHGAFVRDGTEWRFWLKQNDSVKSIQCSNYFPTKIQDFAVHIDGIMKKVGYGTTTWMPVSPEDARAYQKHLWDRIH